MDDFERAIIISFDQSGAIGPELKAQAAAYCERIKQESIISQVCLERFGASNYAEVQFWCLQTLEEIVRLRYASLALQEQMFIRNSVMSLAIENPLGLERPVFVRNKLAQILVILIFMEYPSRWPSVFLDLLSSVGNSPFVVDMFCRIFNALDDELISLDYPRNSEEITIAGRIKDAMREQCVTQIVNSWYDMVVYYRDLRPELAATVLDTMQRYVTWIDIGLVANDRFLSMLFEFLLAEERASELRGSAATCVLAIVSKRMDPQSKIALLRQLQIRRVCGLVLDKQDTEFAVKINALLTGFAQEVLECARKLDSVEPSSESLAAKEVITEMLDTVFPSVIYFLQNGDGDEESNALQFLSNYVSRMKSYPQLNAKYMGHIGQILEVIRVRIRYDPMYRDPLDIPDRIGREEEDRMHEERHDFFVLFRNISRLAPDVVQSFTKNTLSTVLGSSETSFQDVESAISLFHALAEGVSEDTLKNDSGHIGETLRMLLSAQVPFHSHRLVSLIYMETINRYVRFIQQHVKYIPLVLAAFLDRRGIHHPNPNVSGRASYLFMRIVKALRAQLVPFIQDILQSLQDKLPSFAPVSVQSRKSNTQGFEDGSHIFEAVGLLIGMEEVPLDKQSEYLSALLAPLCQQVTVLLADAQVQDPAGSAACLQQVISAINSLSKGFGERLVTTSRPTVGNMFEQTLNVLLQVLLAFPKNNLLRSKVISFLHRMVDTLGIAVFPHLPKAMEQLLVESEPKEMMEFLVLANQLICKFKSAMTSILEEVFPFIVNRVFSIFPKDSIPTGPGSNTEEIRELQELQRTFFTFLHAVTSNDLSAVFLVPKNSEYLNVIIRLLISAACGHKDILVRKSCVQVFIKLIKNWCTQSNEEEKVPGFRNFIIQNFAATCCFSSVLDNAFDFRDAHTKVIYEKCGNDFLVHLAMNIFPSTQCPRDLAEQYCMELQRSDVKALKDIYKSLVERLRVLRNGSMAFR
ncbi:exportin-T isoform X2 [Cryptomeria japonica]|uniref:exportin-T isoform X2 n=1 Tax=Cryptomeria japonica TaxID=3369 RepID=UPI0027D9E1A8|nr:exportin-T isoform X2 [Cryptomeria japonica]